MLIRFLLCAVPLLLQAAEPSVVRASGEGVVRLKPDQATVNIGVVTQAPTADAAAALNAKQLTAVLDQLRGDLGSNADIHTSGYSLNPVYKYGNNAPAITGYSATNMVQVKVSDLGKLGSVLDAATRNGANAIHGIQFGLKNEHAARAQALQQAAQLARANAEVIAASLGLHVVRVRSAEAGAGSRIGPPQPQAMMMAAEARAPTPVESGTIEIHAAVTVTLEVQ